MVERGHALAVDLGSDNLGDLGALFEEGKAEVRGFGVVRVERSVLAGRTHRISAHRSSKPGEAGTTRSEERKGERTQSS